MLYHFANTYDTKTLRNQDVDLIISTFGKVEHDFRENEDVRLAFEVVPESSKLCKFLVNLYTNQWPVSSIQDAAMLDRPPLQIMREGHFCSHQEFSARHFTTVYFPLQLP
jgi:hypothetical protein